MMPGSAHCTGLEVQHSSTSWATNQFLSAQAAGRIRKPVTGVAATDAAAVATAAAAVAAAAAVGGSGAGEVACTGIWEATTTCTGRNRHCCQRARLILEFTNGWLKPQRGSGGECGGACEGGGDGGGVCGGGGRGDKSGSDGGATRGGGSNGGGRRGKGGDSRCGDGDTGRAGGGADWVRGSVQSTTPVAVVMTTTA
eukprot:scaffold8531_cov130-Isochrysis_galbana.AAC.3